MSGMRILFCNYEYPPLGGGGGVINALLAEELAKRHHEVTVLTSQGLRLLPESLEHGVRVIRAPVVLRKKQAVANALSLLAFIPAGIAAGKRLLRKERFDVINTHFVLPSGPVGDVLARYGSIPNVLTVHGGDLYDPSKSMSPHRHPLLRMWIRRLARRADRVVGQSSNTLENLRRFYAPEIEGVRIPLGIKRPVFGPASRAAYGIGMDEVLLVTVGRLVSRKAVSQLITIMQAFKARPVRLLIMGDGPQEPELRQQAMDQRLERQVLFLGHLHDAEKFQVLRMCDLYVSTSQHEGFGLVFLEAMASRLPVVCYDHGGQTDFLENDRTGFVVPLNDLRAFEQRCRQLIGSPELRRRMGEENRRAVKEFFIERCADHYEALFYELVAGAREKPTRARATTQRELAGAPA